MMRLRIANDKRIRSIAIGLTGALIALLFWAQNWDRAWEAKTWDWRVRLMAEKGRATDDIRLILLDQNSLDWGKTESGWSWPWPREIYGAMVDFCKRGGAKSLAADVLFTEPSGAGVEDDAKLSRSISAYGRMAAAMFTGPDRTDFPIPEVAKTARLLCNVHLQPDPDGVYRRMKLMSDSEGKPVPSLGLGAYLASLPPSGIPPDLASVPLDPDGNAILRYRGPNGTHKTYSAAAILQSELRILSGETPDLKPEVLKDKYVLFGFSAPGLYDLRPSPISGVYPGVEIHATMLDNYLSEDFIRLMPSWITVAGVLLFALAAALSVSVPNSPLGIVAISLLSMSIPVPMSLWCYKIGLWMPLIVCEASVGISVLLNLAVSYATEGRQKRFIKSAFRQYLSPALIEQLISQPDMLRLGGERKMVSIFFSDIQGFTSISEKLEPETLTAFLNDYLTAMTDIIIEEGGTVDKYEGDAIIAFWNAPLEVPGHALRCVRAALRCQEKLAKMRPMFFERLGQNVYMRIGVNTGNAVVGNFGSQTKFDYTMIGDSVNLAARLEGTNKQFGTYAMISEFAREQIGDEFGFREIARVAVMGRQKPVTVFEPMFREEYETKQEIFERFANGLNLFYEGRFSEARQIFSDIAQSDPAAQAYLAKCEELEHSPPRNWQGVWVMSLK